MKAVCLILVLNVFGDIYATAKNLPPYIKKCQLSDPDVNKCVIKNGNEALSKIKHGDKEYKISPISPLKVNEAIIEPGNNLKLTMKNINVYGLDNLTIKGAEVSTVDQVLTLLLHIPQLQITGNYTIDGRIVILPIIGHGKSNITMDNMDLTYMLKYKVDNGLFGITNNSINFKTDRVHYDFDNLFNGEEPLASEMKKFLDENWEEVHKELQGSFNQVISALIEAFVKQIVEDVPYEQVYIP